MAKHTESKSSQTNQLENNKDSFLPLIGINLDVKGGPPEEAAIQTTYTDSILRSGGVPVLLPPMGDEQLKAVLARLDGVMLIGGADYCPSLYNEEADGTVDLAHERRQDFDFRLARQVLAQSMPVLGVCLGAQLLNILQGGSLIQDIKTSLPESKIEHVSKNGWQEGFTRHEVRLEPATTLAAVYGRERFEVTTSHHQSVKSLGRSLKVSALADDGVVEAIEMVDRTFVIGVQWHPERDYETNKPLFDRLVAAAREFAEQKGLRCAEY